jgi:hypothetical protein
MQRRWLLALAIILLFGNCKKKAEQPAPTITEKEIGLPFYPKSTEWGTASSKLAADDTASLFADIVRTNIVGQTKDGRDVEVLVMKMPQQKTQIFLSVARKTTSAPK